MDNEEREDKYGNPIGADGELIGDQLTYCVFPDCGCDGARLCQAKNGASWGALNLNIEKGSLKIQREQEAR